MSKHEKNPENPDNDLRPYYIRRVVLASGATIEFVQFEDPDEYEPEASAEPAEPACFDEITGVDLEIEDKILRFREALETDQILPEDF